MKYIQMALASLASILLLASCASNGPPFVMQNPSPSFVTIYAFRTSSIVGGGNSDIVAVNDRFIGRINSGTYSVYQTEPGLIVVTRKGGSILGSGDNVGWGLGGLVGIIDGFKKVVEFTGKAGDVYFVRFSHGQLVDKKEALSMMDGLENVTPMEK